MDIKAALKVQQLVFHTLKSIDVEIQPDECVVLSGKSGAGKSLMLRAIADLIPHRGECWLGSTACSGMPATQWRQQVGYLSAESFWWTDHIGGHFNDIPGLLKTDWLAQLGFDHSVLDWEVSRCSTGERQRLAVLRLLANKPSALLLDEPTANLDAENMQRVEQLLLAYQREHQCPVLWVSHYPEQIKRVAQRHVRLSDNRLHEMAS